MATPLRDVLVLPEQVVDGPRHLRTILRPLRIAFLVDPASPPLALAAVEAAPLGFGSAPN